MESARLLEVADTVHPTEMLEGSIQGYKQNETFLRKMHHALLEVAVLEGTPQFPEPGHVFPISHRIPNMLRNEKGTQTRHQFFIL